MNATRTPALLQAQRLRPLGHATPAVSEPDHGGEVERRLAPHEGGAGEVGRRHLAAPGIRAVAGAARAVAAGTVVGEHRAPARRRRGRGRQGLEQDAGPLRHELDEGLDPIRHVGVSGILADGGRERRQVGGRQQSQPIVHLPRLGETQARLLELGERLQLGAAILEGFEIREPHAGQELEEAANVCRAIVGAAMGRGDERRQQDEPREGGDQSEAGTVNVPSAEIVPRLVVSTQAP